MRRVSTHQDVRCNILGHNTSRSYHGMFANDNAWHNFRTFPNPCTFFDNDRLALQYHQVIEIMVGSKETDVWGDLHIVFDGDATCGNSV